MSTRTWEQLVDEGRRLVAEEGDIKFKLGDLALEAAPIGAPGVNSGAYERLAKYAESIGVAARTLETYRHVANAWPAPWRYGGAPWTVHMLFASRDDRREFIRGRDRWTYREAAKAAGHKRTYTEREVDPETGEIVRTTTTREKVEQVREHLADPDVASAVVDQVSDRPDLTAQVLERAAEKRPAPRKKVREPSTFDFIADLGVGAELLYRVEQAEERVDSVIGWLRENSADQQVAAAIAEEIGVLRSARDRLDIYAQQLEIAVEGGVSDAALAELLGEGR